MLSDLNLLALLGAGCGPVWTDTSLGLAASLCESGSSFQATGLWSRSGNQGWRE